MMFRPRVDALAVALFCAALAAAFAASPAVSATVDPLETIAQRSGFRVTGRYDEVERLCAQFARSFAGSVRSFEFGRTPEGRPMLALAVSKSGALTPDDAREKGVPVMLAQSGIHAGEIDGKDAGFLAIRALLEDKSPHNPLESFVFVFVPVFNVDGHERFGRNNRPNQNGPEEMGWRATAQNFNLNRDYTRTDAPEMQAMLRLLDAWDPVLYVDLHVTDGAQLEVDVSNNLEPMHTGDADLQAGGKALMKELNDTLSAQGSHPIDFYPTFRDSDDPASGFDASIYPPRFSTGYWATRNRYSLLVETHSWKDYPHRVRVTHNILIKLSNMMAKQGKNWRALARAADARAEKLAGQNVVLDYGVGEHTTMIDFRGYAYMREPSAISGGLVTIYDPTKPQIWHVPFRDTLIPKLTVRAPGGAYVIPAAQAAWMGERLSIHGIRFERLNREARSASVEAFRATRAEFATKPFEGHFMAKLTGEWKPEKRDIPAGSLIVPIAQPKARLIMTLLEPQAGDSYAAWGFFNIAFEQKEYMEPYVAEDVARDMLAHHPAVAAEFKQKLATDPAFAKDPQARLDFFYKHHPSYDETLNLYPILRIANTKP